MLMKYILNMKGFMAEDLYIYLHAIFEERSYESVNNAISFQSQRKKNILVPISFNKLLLCDILKMFILRGL